MGALIRTWLDFKFPQIVVRCFPIHWWILRAWWPGDRHRAPQPLPRFARRSLGSRLSGIAAVAFAGAGFGEIVTINALAEQGLDDRLPANVEFLRGGRYRTRPAWATSDRQSEM